MNKTRRKELHSVANKLLVLSREDDSNIETELDAIKNELSMILYDEEYYMDSIPENFQSGYRYQVAEDACNNIENAIDALDDGDIDDAIKYIYGATV